MRTVNRFWVALALTAATGMPGVAFASPVSSWAGRVLRWNITSTSPALYTYVNSADSKVTAASAVAFSKWQNLTSTYIAFQAGTAGNAQITIDVVNLSNGFASGQASRTFDASGNITSCTVQLSTALVSAASNSAALEPTLTHEIGHCIGLGHSVSSSAVMSYRGGGSDPTDDDIFAVSMLYPNDDNLAYPLGCATVSHRNRPSGPGLPPGGGVEFFALAGLLFLFWRIQRRGEFHRRITGRAPEQRGNGLKFVRETINAIEGRGLFFQTNGSSHVFGSRGTEAAALVEPIRSPRGPDGTFALLLWPLR